MKRIITLLLIITSLGVFASCSKNEVEEDYSKVLETAETIVEVTGNAGSIALDENVARTLLEVYPKETLGLSKELYDYNLKLSATRFLDNDACLVEAFLGEAEKPEGTFVVLGQQCFVYNSKQKKYFLLTVDGTKEIATQSENSSTTEQVTVPTVNDVEKQNNDRLQELFKGYTKEELGLKKDITEYFLVIPGTTTTAEDGEMVFVVRLKDSNGEMINETLAMNDNGNYMFNNEINKYKKLS